MSIASSLARPRLGLAVAFVVTGCLDDRAAAMERARDGEADTAATCEVILATRPLDRTLRETSGLARGLADPTLLWTHNDGGNPPALHALRRDGSIARRVTVDGAANVDWEDIAAGPCPKGGPCLFVADIGDNLGIRKTISIYRVEEPAATARRTMTASRLWGRYPGGPRDAEAIFVLDGKGIFIVTKGRRGAVELYRMPLVPTADTTTMELVRPLFPEAGPGMFMVTGASASPDGRWVAVRTYWMLYLYRSEDLVTPGVSIGGGAFRLTGLPGLEEKQGEGVMLDNDGTVWLTTEGEGLAKPGLSAVRCPLPL